MKLRKAIHGWGNGMAEKLQPKGNWIRSNWKTLVSVLVVVLVVLSIVALIYTQPWSKVKVTISNDYAGRVARFEGVGVNVYIDGELKVTMNLLNTTTVVGEWSVKAGNHVIALDNGTWDVYMYYGGAVGYFNYEPPDGIMDYAYDYSVGPLHTKNVYFNIPLPS